MRPSSWDSTAPHRARRAVTRAPSRAEFAFNETYLRTKTVHAWTAPGRHVPRERISPDPGSIAVAGEQRQLLVGMLGWWRESCPTVPVQPIVALGSPVEQLLR
ncbi:hypothetical protein Asera_59170 [Actinocatenispora sera]|jgi:hypothetical protein|uniref:Uncharacterized protein n=1 Tax=Actinocatenispora sera TaxID=390989 RepID=A0A810L982_9ACTN|nr:hypothetical protein Asera_59170 [Actinocatenispora sera]